MTSLGRLRIFDVDPSDPVGLPPQITTLVTFDADVNAPMVAVNDQLGFVPVQWLGEL